MNKIAQALAVAAALSIVSMSPAQAITSSQRVSVLKYYQCLQYKYFMPWLNCHL